MNWVTSATQLQFARQKFECLSERVSARMHRRNMAEKFVPVEMLGCTALRQLSFLDCEGLVISPVIGELMSLQAR